MTREQLTQAQNEKFNWVGRNQMVYSRSQADVTISRVKADRKGSPCRYSVILRGRAYEAFKNSPSLEVAIFKNRIMLRESSIGFKMSPKDTINPTLYVSIPHTEDTAALGEFIGDYTLQRDDFYELYYIEEA